MLCRNQSQKSQELSSGLVVVVWISSSKPSGLGGRDLKPASQLQNAVDSSAINLHLELVSNMALISRPSSSTICYRRHGPSQQCVSTLRRKPCAVPWPPRLLPLPPAFLSLVPRATVAFLSTFVRISDCVVGGKPPLFFPPQLQLQLARIFARWDERSRRIF